ncbi:hypothetical protein BD410DRAFT_791210 [Rickenella mellea]|uniref:Uncharacterized protein n=1 Tax=Rickenella mellea TaxID=50990 RepID=A0A4Y7Q015_9AGAM|nr:hypothetical protein BD410DRAFT_791210 [Rickenella mellea]
MYSVSALSHHTPGPSWIFLGVRSVHMHAKIPTLAASVWHLFIGNTIGGINVMELSMTMTRNHCMQTGHQTLPTVLAVDSVSLSADNNLKSK